MITLIIVIYNISIEESQTIKSLEKILSNYTMKTSLHVIIYDNSLDSQEKRLDTLSLNQLTTLEYKHDMTNPGIAKAYNFGADKALNNHSKWLVLLDQDSELTSDYVKSMWKEIGKNRSDVIVPIVTNQDKPISPVNNITQQTYQPGVYVNEDMMAINSGMAVNLGFIKEIGGFNTNFPLDYLDHWFFFKVKENSKSITVVPATIEHDLSIKSLKTVSKKRYTDILWYEKIFTQTYRPSEMKKYYLHSVLRFFKCLVVSPSKSIVVLKIIFKPTIIKGGS